MSREQGLLLRDIIEACRKISLWTRDVGLKEFSERGMVYSAVLRELFVIGEAAKLVSEANRSQAPAVPWREWAGLRDVVAHQYFGLRDATLWEIVSNEVSVSGICDRGASRDPAS